MFSQILELAPNLELDLFATRINTQLDLFVSPFPDPLAVGGRRANNSVARHRSPVCVPPTSVDPTVTRKTTPRASTVVTDSSSMAATSMVSGPAEAVSNQCSTVAPLSGHTRSNWLDTSKARDFQSSRLDFIRGNLNTRGYSDKVSATLA